MTGIVCESPVSPVPRKEQLLALLAREWVTPMVALERMGTMALNARCGEYRAVGILLLDEWRTMPSGARVKAHRLAEPLDAALGKWRAGRLALRRRRGGALDEADAPEAVPALVTGAAA